jgi:radical SAM superfamily enzyme YgiQ (UPF0313 family)
MKRVLLTTVYNKMNVITDMVAEHVKTYPRAGAVVRVSPGLRFLKQNVPEVEVLEYPSWEEYTEKLKEGWDVVGFSVYLYQIPEILEMIEAARLQGVEEIWAGNYGAPFPAMEDAVDRVVEGPGFNEVAGLFGYVLDSEKIEHPAILANVTVMFGLRFFSFGILYTAFGCPYRCSFCQTPTFIRERLKVSIESIDRVLAYYRSLGIKYVAIFDETFGADPAHYDEVTRLLAEHKMFWAAQSRVEIFLANFERWYPRGLRLPGIGVEFMDEGLLEGMNKKQALAHIRDWAETSRKPGMFRYAFSIVGHPDMDREATIRDARRLLDLRFEINRASVLTPFPNTELWRSIDSRYGIDEPDLHRYDSRHLIWRHPTIGKEEMQELLHTLKTTYNSSWRLYRDWFGRVVYDEWRAGKGPFLRNYLLNGIRSGRRHDDRLQVYFPNFPGHKIVHGSGSALALEAPVGSPQPSL